MKPQAGIFYALYVLSRLFTRKSSQKRKTLTQHSFSTNLPHFMLFSMFLLR